MFNPNQAYPIGAKVEIRPSGFPVGVKATTKVTNKC